MRKRLKSPNQAALGANWCDACALLPRHSKGPVTEGDPPQNSRTFRAACATPCARRSGNGQYTHTLSSQNALVAFAAGVGVGVGVVSSVTLARLGDGHGDEDEDGDAMLFSMGVCVLFLTHPRVGPTFSHPLEPTPIISFESFCFWFDFGMEPGHRSAQAYSTVKLGEVLVGGIHRAQSRICLQGRRSGAFRERVHVVYLALCASFRVSSRMRPKKSMDVKNQTVTVGLVGNA